MAENKENHPFRKGKALAHKNTSRKHSFAFASCTYARDDFPIRANRAASMINVEAYVEDGVSRHVSRKKKKKKKRRYEP